MQHRQITFQEVVSGHSNFIGRRTLPFPYGGGTNYSSGGRLYVILNVVICEPIKSWWKIPCSLCLPKLSTQIAEY